jgi:hypothetical protein
VFETVASTMPRPTVVSTTFTGFCRPSHQTSAASAATMATPMSTRRVQGFAEGLFILVRPALADAKRFSTNRTDRII